MARWTPCDDSYICPFIGPDTTTGMYFCRDMCGLGVDETHQTTIPMIVKSLVVRRITSNYVY